MDRTKALPLPQFQIGFINFIVGPLFRDLSGVPGLDLSRPRGLLAANLERWHAKKERAERAAAAAEPPLPALIPVVKVAVTLAAASAAVKMPVTPLSLRTVDGAPRVLPPLSVSPGGSPPGVTGVSDISGSSGGRQIRSAAPLGTLGAEAAGDRSRSGGSGPPNSGLSSAPAVGTSTP
jgi:hypothetical protein